MKNHTFNLTGRIRCKGEDLSSDFNAEDRQGTEFEAVSDDNHLLKITAWSARDLHPDWIAPGVRFEAYECQAVPKYNKINMDALALKYIEEDNMLRSTRELNIQQIAKCQFFNSNVTIWIRV